MQIDWFTYTAQLLNFAVLVWLLKRFLYGPVIQAIDDREASITQRQQEAERAVAESQSAQTRYQSELDELLASRNRLRLEAEEEVSSWKRNELQAASEDVRAARTEWRKTLARDRHSLITELQIDAARHAAAMGRHLFTELADADIQSQLVTRFLEELESCDSELLAGDDCRDVTVVLADECSTGDEDRLRNGVQQRLPEASVQFQTNPDIIAGVELQLPNRRLAWSVRESMAELESQLVDLLDRSLPPTEAPQRQQDGES